MAVQSSDLAVSINIYHGLRTSEAQQNPAVESIICNHLASMQVDVSHEMIRNLDGEGGFFTGESSHHVRSTIEQNSNELGRR
jgi:hypothetical protein